MQSAKYLVNKVIKYILCNKKYYAVYASKMLGSRSIKWLKIKILKYKYLKIVQTKAVNPHIKG